MAKIVIDQQKCKGCLLCISACPRGLIKLDNTLNLRGVKPVKFVTSKKAAKNPAPEKSASDLNYNGVCIGCMQCALICPECCITVYK